MDDFYLFIIVIYVAINLIVAGYITCGGSNYKLNSHFWYYFVLSFLLSPIVAVLFALLDVLTKSQKQTEQVEQEHKPTPPQGGKVWIADDNDKRIEIYQSELDFYIEQGWHLLGEQPTPPPTNQ